MKEEEEEGLLEFHIQRAILSRLTHINDDSLTSHDVRRLLEKDLGLQTYALDVHQEFIGKWLTKLLESSSEDEVAHPLEKKVKNFPPKAPICKELNPESLKHARSSGQADLVHTPLQTSFVKQEQQPAACSTPGPTLPTADPPKSKRFKMAARKGSNPVIASCKKASVPCPSPLSANKQQPAACPTPGPTCPSTDPPKPKRFKMMAKKRYNPVSCKKASVPYPSPKSVNKTTVPLVNTESPIGLEREPVKPTQEEDPDSFFASLMKKATPATSEPSNATASAMNPPSTAEEIEQAKSNFSFLLHLSFPEILLSSSETFAKTLKTLVMSRALGHDLQPALQLFKHAFPSLSQTYSSTNQSKAEVDAQLQRADDLSAKLSQGLDSYRKLKTNEEGAQAEKKAVTDQIFLLQLRLSKLDDKLIDLSLQKEVLYQNMKANCIVYEKLERELPSLSSTKSKLEAELAETEKAWENFKSRFDSL